MSSSPEGSAAEEIHARYFANVLSGPIPHSHKDVFNKIVAQEEKTWEQRTDEVKDMLMDLVKFDPELVPCLGSQLRVYSWINKVKDQHNEVLNQAKKQGII